MIFSLLGSSFFSTFILYIFISCALFYIWFKVINMENEIFLLTDKVKKLSNGNNQSNNKQQPLHNSCSINNPYCFKMEDIILKEVFDNKIQNDFDLSNTTTSSDKVVIDNDEPKNDDNSNEEEIFDLKKSSEQENEGSEISTTKKGKKAKK